MVIYRPHRGGLAESLVLAKEFETFEDMKQYIYQTELDSFRDIGLPAPFDIDDIIINEDQKMDDPRCHWHDTMYVCVKRYGNEDYMKEYGTPQCIGMCATDYENMSEEKIENICGKALKTIEEKQEKSLKRLEIFSWVFFFVGLEVLGILMHYEIHLAIKIIAIDVYAFTVGRSFYKLGMKDGVNIEKEYHKMGNERNEEIISKLKGVVFKSGE